MSKVMIYIVLGLVISILIGVGVSCDGRPRPAYRVTVVNLTGEELGGVLIWFGRELVANTGHTVVNGNATDSKMFVPVTDEADVRIVTAAKADHRQKVSLKGIVPTNFQGNIYFRLLPDGSIEVKTADANDVDGNVKWMR